MKYKFILEFLLGCMILFITAQSQIPSWEPVIASFSEDHYYYVPDYPPDVEADGAGIHYVFKNSNGDIRYYLIGSDGVVIESFTLDQGERPAVAAYHNDVYVLYYKQGFFKGKVRSFDGQNWSAWADIQSFEVEYDPEQTDAVMDERGVHLVWNMFGEVWYYRYDPALPQPGWIDLKNINDHPGSYDGRWPTIVTSSDRVHITYNGYWDPVEHNAILNRDYQVSTSNWHDPQFVGKDYIVTYNNVAVSEGYLHSFYKANEGPSPIFTYLVWKKRPVNGGAWSNSVFLAGDFLYPWFERQMTVDNNGIHITYWLGKLYYRHYSEATGWEMYEEFADDVYIVFPPAVSSNQTGIFALWVTEEPTGSNKNYFRHKPKAIFDDIAENTLWTGNVWIGDTQQPREVINIPAGVTVTLDDDATLYLQGNWINVYGTLYYDPANVEHDGGEIFIYNNGIAYNVGSGSATIDGEGSCISVKPGGRFVTVNSSHQLNFADGALFLNDGGTVELADNSKMIFEATSQKLKINPGSIFKLGDKARIEVQSKLDAQGSLEEPIIFTSLYQNPTPSQYWTWLKIVGQGQDDPDVLKHAKIEYADYGLFAYNANITIEDNTVQNNRLYNLYLSNCQGYLANNTIQNADVYDGIFVTNSSPELYENFISGNSGSGVYCYGYSSPKFGFDMTGNNIIVGNDIGVFARQYSNPFLGDAEAGTGGDNSIYSNVSYAVKAIEYCNVLAQSNWWGDYPPSEEWFYADERSYIDYSYALEDDPNEEIVARTFRNTIEGYEISRGSGADSLLRLARKYRFQKRPQIAIAIYRQLINNHANTAAARWGLVEILLAFKEAKLDSSVNFLQRIKTNVTNVEMKRIAYDMLTGSFLNEKNIKDAINNCQDILSLYSGTESEKLALFDLFNIQLNLNKDSLQAQSALAALEQKYPNDRLTMIAQHQIGSGTGSNKIESMALGTTPPEKNMMYNALPQDFRLHQNHPNPFNPSTTVAFDLPQNSFVELEIYDISARKVKTLLSKSLEAGSHRAVWDGRDDLGNQAASGVYFYRVKAVSLENTEVSVKINKMILLR